MINKIIISTTSGYCHINDAYHEILTIGRNIIQYEYLPSVVSETHPMKKWSHETLCPEFESRFEELSASVPQLLEQVADEMCKDIGSTEFIIIFKDNTEFKKVYWCPAPEFKEIFSMVRKMVPKKEKVLKMF